jgi:hypothetical protein
VITATDVFAISCQQRGARAVVGAPPRRRCRFSVYREISRIRHAANGVVRSEPAGDLVP